MEFCIVCIFFYENVSFIASGMFLISDSRCCCISSDRCCSRKIIRRDTPHCATSYWTLKGSIIVYVYVYTETKTMLRMVASVVLVWLAWSFADVSKSCDRKDN